MITELQAWVVDQLAADPLFAGPPNVLVLTERKADFLATMHAEINSRIGLCVVVTVPKLSHGPGNFGAIKASIAVHFWENVTINESPTGTNLSAVDAATLAMTRLARMEPPGGWDPLLPGDIAVAEMGSGILMYELPLTTGIILKRTS